MASSTAEWQCQISLRLNVDERGLPLPTTRNIPFGDTIKDKAQVEERIRRAQFAILNPRRDPASFLSGPPSSLSNDSWTLSFSSNCISVRISGSGVDDLSFVDLPGKRHVAYKKIELIQPRYHCKCQRGTRRERHHASQIARQESHHETELPYPPCRILRE